MNELTCPDAEVSLGALVLGALDPSEREQVEAHVRTCPPCAAALAEVAPMAGLLNRVALTTAELEPVPDAVLDRALDEVRRSAQADPSLAPVVPLRRRRLPLLVAAAAVLALVLGGVWWTNQQASVGSVTASASSTASGVKASVVMTPSQEGTTLDLTLSGVTPGQHCALVAVSPDGEREVASTWVANYEGEASLTGTTSLPLADIATLDITTPDGQTLLTIDVPA